MDQNMQDRLAIRALVENWVVWRDAGDWDRFATTWHPDGWMSATWFQGPAADFIAASRQGFENGVSILHFLGGHTSDVAGDRAIAQRVPTGVVLFDLLALRVDRELRDDDRPGRDPEDDPRV